MNSMGRFWCVIIIFLLCGSAIAGDKTNAYQKGTITEGLSATHKFYELKDGAHGYRFNGCGDFQAGQVVDYRLESDKLHIRRENGAEDKCAIKGRMTFDEPSPPVAEPTAPANYVKGIIQGYEELYRYSKGTLSGVRTTKVYRLRGPDLIYEIDFCGAFQAGQFKEGQVVAYRVEGERLYVFRGEKNKDYNCQIEAKLKREGAGPAESTTQTRTNSPAPVTSTPSSATFSITSVPDGADIEVDGNFSGNTPSELEVLEGEHSVSVKKTGYTNWERKMKVVAGSKIHLNAELTKAIP